MAKRLTDKQKKKIIADYVECGSYNAVAKMNGVSHHTVKRVVEEVPGLAQKIQQKKEQNTADVLAHMEKKRDKVCEIIDTYLERLLDPEKLDRSTVLQLATTLGILIDKFTMQGVEKVSETIVDDPLSKALKEEAERMQNENSG